MEHQNYLVSTTGDVVDQYIIDIPGQRVKIRQMQEQAGEPILFCLCQKQPIPMLLTAHGGGERPHLKTKGAGNEGLHYYKCRHNTSPENRYHSFVEQDEDGNIVYHVQLDRKKHRAHLEKVPDGYSRDYLELGNFSRRIETGQCTWETFVFRRNLDLDSRLRYRGDKQISFPEFNFVLLDALRSSRFSKDMIAGSAVPNGSLLYFPVGVLKQHQGKHLLYTIEPLASQMGRMRFPRFPVHVDGRVFSESMERFQSRYNGLLADTVLGRDDAFLVAAGYYVTHSGTGRDGAAYQAKQMDILDFLLVNRDGLVCESLPEAMAYNLVREKVLQERRVFFYKPFGADDRVYRNERLIPDGVVRRKPFSQDRLFVVEIFGFASEDYRKNMDEKLSSCRFPLVYWDVQGGEDISVFEKRLDKAIRDLSTKSK